MELAIKFFVYLILGIMTILSLTQIVLNYKNRYKPLPENVSDVYNEEKYNEWLKYSFDKLKLSVIKSIVITSIYIILLSSNVLVIIGNMFTNLTSDVALNSILYIILINLGIFIIDSLFKYYNTFVIEEKYGFNKTTKKLFLKDTLRNCVISLLFLSILSYLVISLYLKFGLMLIVYATVIITLVLVLIMFLYGKIFSKLGNRLTPLEDGELRDKIVNLATKTNFEISNIFISDSSKRSTKANAFCTGFGKQRRIVLYDTLLKQVTTDEIVSIVAHEIGHAKKKHTIKSIPFSILNILIIVSLLFLFFSTKEFSTSFGFSEVNYGFIIIILSVLISPISLLIGILSNIISRKHEFEADNFAKEHCGSEIMISALKTLSRENFSNLNPHKLDVILNYSHPTTSKRIENLNK